MRYVILRDDDTNALTPPEYLERLYRPFLDQGWPVNLAVIPNVRTDITYGQNILEGFLLTRRGTKEKVLPVSQNEALIQYLLSNPGYQVVQHGYNHEFVNGDCEFEQHDRKDLVRRLENGSQILVGAGLKRPDAFAAPYDRFTRTSLQEVGKRFRLISGAWFEFRRLPPAWWPSFALKKVTRKEHWHVGRTILLSHPPCYLSHRRPYATMLNQIKQAVASRQLTVLVTHWWEFFHDGGPDEAFIQVLHDLASFLAAAEDLAVVGFDDVVQGKVPVP
jgi:hypothetical protein